MSYLPIEFVEWIVVHGAATPADMDIGLEEIRRWHLQRGFADVGYHYIIRRDGTVEKGRNDIQPGAHARGYNMHSLGICMVGGLKKGTTKAENNYTEAQFISLEKLLGELQKDYPEAEILGHRDLPGTTTLCPSFDVREWLAYLRKQNDITEQVPTRDSDAPSIPRRRGSCWASSSRDDS